MSEPCVLLGPTGQFVCHTEDFFATLFIVLDVGLATTIPTFELDGGADTNDAINFLAYIIYSFLFNFFLIYLFI
jgi:hypothetical protein